MTIEQFQKYAETVLSGYIPIDDAWGIYLLENNRHRIHIEQLRNSLLNSQFSIAEEVKFAVAENMTQRLEIYYDGLQV